MLLKSDPVRAFMPYPAVEVPNTAEGPLAGLTFAVKDLFDVAGYRTGCGCPMKLAESDVKGANAPPVQRLLDAGARFVGKTHTDELAWSLYGMNAHFGTPINSAASDRIPGGSSSGSAAAVAAGLADIGIGTDTGGSVRAPSSFCGLWGLRPTHGRIPLDGCMELAASFDTCGFFARDAGTFIRAGAVLLGDDTVTLPDDPRFLRPADMVERLGPRQRAVYDDMFGGLEAASASVYPEGGADALYEAYRILQGCDAKRSIVPYIEKSGMPLARGIDSRYAHARSLTDADEEAGGRVRATFRAHLDALLGIDGVLLAPVVHDAPFKLDAADDVFESFRHLAMRLLCVSGMSGLPQVVLPAGRIDGAPYGVSLIGPRGCDQSLIALAARLAKGGLSPLPRSVPI
ncbi:amidase [Rhizobium petrolearium]|uniref:amidase n=1 Tax=Neorhizobium petrolearium TaxID=515361 RepID=UPI001AEA7637|nr:amidase [Neorhizobium petrolearium]MBP1845511.1 amidase [Neorhizobium petrolearium]